MKKLLLLTKTLLAAALLCVGQNAWGETIATMGDTDKNWYDDGSYTSYTVEANKTLTLNFTVSSVKGDSDNDGYFVDLKQNNVRQMAVECSGGFCYREAGEDVWWDWSHNEAFECTWWNDPSWAANFRSIAPGAVVELTIRRHGTQVTYFADITTTSSERHYLRFISPASTLDENADLEVIFGANHAVLTSITDVTTDESITGTLIGREDNHADFNGTGAVNQAFTLGADKTLELNFINYTSKIGWGDNWMVEIQNGTKYLDLKADFSGWDAGMVGDEHYFVRTEDNTQAAYFTLTSSTGLYFDNFPKALHKARVNLTVARSGSTITITAVQTCTSSEVKTQTYTLTHDDFASGDVTVRLMAAWSHLDLLPVTTSISEYGWATFSSDYALDFSKATEGLEAYMITGHDGNVVTKSQVTGTVPAGTGLLLKGDKGSYNIPIVGSSSTDVSGNKLVAGTGASVSYEAGKTKYVLGVSGSEEAEFQKIVDGGSAATVAKGKAYLQFNEVLAARTMSFSGDITGVENVEAAPTEAKAKDGKFIENGKLVIVKNGQKFNAAGAKLY